ncbi:MAG: hypothetical protein KGY60_11840 [Bacteroidales bacterium]|nr:hypothetical protein [Bacteroidales bacterium]
MSPDSDNKSTNLSFGTITPLDSGIYEIIAYPDMEIKSGHIQEIMDFLKQQPDEEDFGILINRKHSYHYAFDAMRRFGTLKMIRAIAVLAENRQSYIRSKTIVGSLSIVSQNSRKIELFRDRNRALKWLKESVNNQSD